MSRMSRHRQLSATALATLAALAGSCCAAPTAMAKATTEAGTETGVAPPDGAQRETAIASAANSPDTGHAPDGADQTAVAQPGIAPDLSLSTEEPIDTGSQAEARQALDRQHLNDDRMRRFEQSSERLGGEQDAGRGRPLWIAPYIDAMQVVDSQLSPVGDTLTYSVLGVGADMGAATARYQGSLSLRYERRIGWGRAESSNAVSGLGRAAVDVAPHLLTMEVAGYANRVHIDGQGATTDSLGNPDSLTQIYAVMAGPSLAASAGDLEIKGHYRIGYAHVGSPNQLTVAAGQTPADIFDHSTMQDAHLRVGVQPGDVLPVGLAVEGAHYRETVSNLDQQEHDSHVRGEVVVPLAEHLAAIGGVGYEWSQVSSRDALRDSAGNPVISPSGRLVTDPASPRIIAFDSEALIWDVGVVWRPSPRTNLEAHVGRRYGTIGGDGRFSYRPDGHSSFDVQVYNNLTSFGGMLTNALDDTPTQFTAIRDPLTGNIGACVSGSGSGGGAGCLASSLSTVRSTVFRGRGANARYLWHWDRYTASVGIGYDHRSFIAAPGTVLASLDGKSEEYYWTAANLAAQLDRKSSISAEFDSYIYRGDVAATSNFTGARAAAAYQYQFSSHLGASAGLEIDTLNRTAIEDAWHMSGQVAMRYSF